MRACEQGQEIVIAELWELGRRVGFCWYDLKAERLWPRVAASVAELESNDRAYFRQPTLHPDGGMHERRDALAYVNDSRRRTRGRHTGVGIHWPVTYCRACSSVEAELEPWDRAAPTENTATEWESYYRWRRLWPRPGHPFPAQRAA